MGSNKKSRLALFSGMLLGSGFVAAPARAANITLDGAIQTDDAVQLFDLTVAAPGTVDLRRYSYARGMVVSGIGALGLAGFRRIRPFMARWRLSLLLMVFAGVSRSQTPDYSNVNDYLNGQRTLLSVNDFAVGGVLFKTNDGTQIPSDNISTLPNFSNNVIKDAPQVFARMFNLSYDVLTHVFYDERGNIFIYALDPNSQADQSVPVLSPDSYVYNVAKGNLSGTGFDDVVVVADDRLQVISAVDPQNFSKGLKAGPAFTLPSAAASPGRNVSQVVVGDFAGNGTPEIAVTYQVQYSAHGNPDYQATKLTLAIFKVDRNTLAITPVSSIDVEDQGFPLQYVTYRSALAAGRFGNTRHDQIVTAHYRPTDNTKGGPSEVTVTSFDFDAALQPHQLNQVLSSLQGTSVANLYTDLALQKGHFDPQSPYDQAALKFDRNLGILSFDTNLQIHLPTFLAANVGCSSGLAVGSFARTDPDPQDPTKTQPSLKSQLAITTEYGNTCVDAESLGIHIYNVDPPARMGQDFVIEPKAVYSAEFTNDYKNFYRAPITAGDVQGRSYVLGEPTKVTLTNSLQPTAIIAAPPMHIDFMSPDPRNDAQQRILNLTGTPDGFYTKYSTQDSTNTSSTTTSDNGWSFSGKEQIGGSIEFGSVEKGEGSKFSDTFTATQQLNHTYGHTWGSYTDYKFGVAQQTGVDDQVWYSQSRFNIWIYPVLGKTVTVCPVSKSPCGPGNPGDVVPLNVQFSGPDQIQRGNTVGNLLPWYQPPWEPFNVLSYPASYSQLQQIFPDIAKLSADIHFFTDNSSTTISSTWEAGNNDQRSAGYDRTYSEDNDLSAVAAGDAGIFSVGLSADLDFGGSNSFHDLTQGATTLSKSTGIDISKPSSFADPFVYGYDVTPYIFGRLAPGGLVDNTPLSTDISTFGLLQTAFVADPTVSNAGGWWRQAYGVKPDVALNHPARWSLSEVPQQNPLPDGCLAVGAYNQMDCATKGRYTPADPWNSAFQSMRGFFISDARSSSRGPLLPGRGPLLETAKPGTVLMLQARVYNYSLKTMDASTQVHVRFYAQPWDHTLQAPLKDKPSFLVGENLLGPVPPFNAAEGAPLNWVLANTTFDTSNYEDQYFTFWVVVWMEDPSGNLVPEIDQHGLKVKPGTLTAFTDLSEEVYGNNVGFFRMAFYVQPKATGVGVSPGTQSGAVNLSKVSLPASTMLPGEHMIISAMLSAEDIGAAGPSVLFYDGDPQAGGSIFGFDQASYVRPNDDYKVSSIFQAKTCGSHQLFLVVNQGTSTKIIRRAPPVQVDCSGSAASKLKNSFSQQR